MYIIYNEPLLFCSIPGVRCESTCDRGRFGPNCQDVCDCENASSCDPVSGQNTFNTLYTYEYSICAKRCGLSIRPRLYPTVVAGKMVLG
jgi:hypothetical protein